MSERRLSAASLTRRAIERINDGEIEDARLILAEALDLDPGYEQAWLWFAHIAGDPGERRFALEQAAAANPESRAHQELPRYRRVAPVEPPEVSDVVPPPPPPDAPGKREAVRERISATSTRKLIGGVIGVFVLLALVFAALFIVGERREDPIYIAIAGGMSGSTAASGTEVVESARLYFDRLNRDEGGIGGRPVELLVFDDQNSAEGARAVANEIVADGRAMLVLGHNTSSASLAAGPIYAAAGIPAITSTATADAITAENPWYFRTVFDNRMQGFLIAAYIRNVLDIDDIVVLGGNDDYGQSLSAGVVDAFARQGERAELIEIDLQGDQQASIAAALAALQDTTPPSMIVIALQADAATEMIVAIRDAGITTPILGGDAIGSNRFLAIFDAHSRDQEDPGFYTDGLYAASPLIMDSLTSDSLRWFEAFRAAYDHDPTWRGATTFDASIAAATAMQEGAITGAADQRDVERMAIRDELVAMNDPETAVPGLLGPIYFDDTRTTPRSAVFGVAHDGQFSSAFVQLRPYRPSASEGTEADLASGVAIDVDGQLLEQRRIVFAGLNINELGELDTANPSFFADFFLWFNYTGDDAATDIIFVNAVDPELELGEPVRDAERDGVRYRLYRVAGRFKAPLEFQDFPFDEQHLLISFQNRTLPSSKIVYAVDREFLGLTREERLQSGTNAAVSINTIPSWRATDLSLYQDTVGSTALMGDPEANVGSSGIEYSLFTADIAIARELAAFLIKNLLPLGLLAAITYVSLFFPHSQTGQRVAFGVSAILTTAVLLTSVTSALPQVGYTVAIEWGFYAFIFLSATCIFIGLVGDWLYEARRYSELRRLDLFSHLYYPAFVLAVVLAYVVRFGGA